MDKFDWKAVLLFVLTRIVLPLLAGGGGALAAVKCC